MKSALSRRLSVLAFAVAALAFTASADAAQKSTPATPVATTSTTPPAAPVSTDTPAPAPTTPPAVPAAAAATPAAPAAKVALPASVTSGDVTMSHMSAEMSHGHIDVFMTLKNNGTSDERVIGGGSNNWDIGEVVQVKKDKDGKEVESPVSVDIPTGKSVELSSSEIWLRVKSIKTAPKDESVLPLSLYFRHSPNANLQISTAGAKGITGAISGWFGK